MGDIKERRNGQKDETKAKRRNKRRCEKSRPAIARRHEGGIKRGKSVSFETRGLSIGRETQNCTAGFSIFSKLDRDKERGKREGLAEESPLLRDRTNCGTGPQEAPDAGLLKKKQDWGSQFLTHLMSNARKLQWLRRYSSTSANNIFR